MSRYCNKLIIVILSVVLIFTTSINANASNVKTYNMQAYFVTPIISLVHPSEHILSIEPYGATNNIVRPRLISTNRISNVFLGHVTRTTTTAPFVAIFFKGITIVAGGTAVSSTRVFREYRETWRSVIELRTYTINGNFLGTSTVTREDTRIRFAQQ